MGVCQQSPVSKTRFPGHNRHFVAAPILWPQEICSLWHISNHREMRTLNQMIEAIAIPCVMTYREENWISLSFLFFLSWPHKTKWTWPGNEGKRRKETGNSVLFTHRVLSFPYSKTYCWASSCVSLSLCRPAMSLKERNSVCTIYRDGFSRSVFLGEMNPSTVNCQGTCFSLIFIFFPMVLNYDLFVRTIEDENKIWETEVPWKK